MSPFSVEYEQLRLAEEIGRLGSFARNLETNEVQWSAGLRRLLFLPDEVHSSIEGWMEMVDPEYRDFAVARGQKTPNQLKQDTVEYPMVPFEGSPRVWLRIRSRTVLLGGVKTSVGVAYDITPQVSARAEADALREQLISANQQLADTVTVLEMERQWRAGGPS